MRVVELAQGLCGNFPTGATNPGQPAVRGALLLPSFFTYNLFRSAFAAIARARNSLYVAYLKEGICYVSPLDPHAKSYFPAIYIYPHPIT